MPDLDVNALAASLADIAKHLEEHVDVRAYEKAAPRILHAEAQADAAREQQIADAAAFDQRLADARREMERQWVWLEKHAARLRAERDDARAKLAEYEAIRAAVTEGGHLHLDRPLTVSDVLVAHDVTRKALADALGMGRHLNWAQLVAAAERLRTVATEDYAVLLAATITSEGK